MIKCSVCKNEIIGEIFSISSVFSEKENGGPCCSKCYERFGELDSKILDDLKNDQFESYFENSFFDYLSESNMDMEIQIDGSKQLVFFKKGQRPIMTLFCNYKEFLEGLDTNFPIVNVYGNSLDGNYTKLGMWIISYDHEMDKKIGDSWCKSNQIDDLDLPF